MNPFDDALRSWRALPRRRPGELADARLQAHWAAQLVELAGKTLVPEPTSGSDGWSHLAMTWLDPLELLAGGFTRTGVRVALRVSDLCLAVLDADDRIEWSFCLDGKTVAEALGWLREVLAEEGETVFELGSLRDDRPHHPVRTGAPFRLDELAHFEELSRWLGNCARIFQAVCENTQGAGPLNCWPHDFDLATRIVLDPDEPSEAKRRSLGVGLSLGDSSYDEPYLYVTPSPEPLSVESEPLAGNGHWHTEGFVGAVLPAHRLPDTYSGAGPDHHAQEQAEQVFAFLRSAIAAGRGLLGVL